ncbi:MAG TPA: hypothetical protein VNY76_01265 [Candidatus Acidoferrales bacterium]|nr:hypothetical protein [Candidatus Acidoferrales bacterium]
MKPHLRVAVALAAGLLSSCSGEPSGQSPPSPTPLAVLSEANAQFTSPSGADYILVYDAGAACPEFFDISYAIVSAGHVFPVGNVPHDPGRHGTSPAFTLLGSPSGTPYVFFIGTHPAGAPPQGKACPGWAITIYPAAASGSR